MRILLLNGKAGWGHCRSSNNDLLWTGSQSTIWRAQLSEVRPAKPSISRWVPIVGIYAGRPLASRELVLSHFPNAEYTQIPGTGHFQMLETRRIQPVAVGLPRSTKVLSAKRLSAILLITSLAARVTGLESLK
ncbi:MAG: hypothetical protein JO033_04030 [Acidobacteriaceae bacterium]|nr:hypothetical protein [Acidobacteriaceae bacterium]